MRTVESEIFEFRMACMGCLVVLGVFPTLTFPRSSGPLRYILELPGGGVILMTTFPCPLSWLHLFFSSHLRMLVLELCKAVGGDDDRCPTLLLPSGPPGIMVLLEGGPEWPLPPSSVSQPCGCGRRQVYCVPPLGMMLCPLSATAALVRLKLTYMFWNIRENLFLFIEL